MSLVWVQIADDCVVCIFKNHKAAIVGCHLPVQIEKVTAVKQIRLAVFKRDNWTCTHCGATVTWNGPTKGELHERVWRGRGGNISLDNSTTLCYHCHQLDPVAGHGKRQIHWQK